MKHKSYRLGLAYIVAVDVLAVSLIMQCCGCATEPWQMVEVKSVCRHKVAAWVEGARTHGLNPKQVWYIRDNGIGHAVVGLTNVDGSQFYLDVLPNGNAVPIELSEQEKKSIWWNDYRYNDGQKYKITRRRL